MTIGGLIQLLFIVVTVGALVRAIYRKLAGSSKEETPTTESGRGLGLADAAKPSQSPRPASPDAGAVAAGPPTSPPLPQTKVGRIVGKVIDHLKSQGLAPAAECWDGGNTCNVNVVIAGARYRVQIMDPSEYRRSQFALTAPTRSPWARRRM